MKKVIYIINDCYLDIDLLFSSQSGEESSKTSGFILSLLPFFNNIESAEFYIHR